MRPEHLSDSRYEITREGFIASSRKPLIFTTVYGADAYYECLGLFLRSLGEVGAYDGDIAVFADRGEAEAEQYVPDSLRPRTIWRSLDAPSFRSRYVALDASFAPYGPIIHLDTDIIIDRPISPLIDRLAFQPGVSVTTETERYGALAAKPASEVEDTGRIGNWWGLELLRADPTCADKPCPLVNGGILAYDQYDTFETVARLILSLMDHPAHERLFEYFGDQPFLNYILVKTNLGAYESFRGLCRFAGAEAPSPEEACGFTHFVWARGSEKLDVMREYLGRLLAQRG